ncbi:hypothetical protein O181_036685 [Austropuccinia psidii MF-1]|uniref:Uncharacterized protein n=1 Tax=Austropuccinia psidii MF-1 TaxID=1389203 RepID=A0A9Q3D9F0_9BASI|nr:hypothetical protein [Austropuccinia psidii MF-1]
MSIPLSTNHFIREASILSAPPNFDESSQSNSRVKHHQAIQISPASPSPPAHHPPIFSHSHPSSCLSPSESPIQPSSTRRDSYNLTSRKQTQPPSHYYSNLFWRGLNQTSTSNTPPINIPVRKVPIQAPPNSNQPQVPPAVPPTSGTVESEPQKTAEKFLLKLADPPEDLPRTEAPTMQFLFLERKKELPIGICSFFSALLSLTVAGPESAFTFPQNNQSSPIWKAFMALEFGKIVIKNNLKEFSRYLEWSQIGNTRGYSLSILI